MVYNASSKITPKHFSTNWFWQPEMYQQVFQEKSQVAASTKGWKPTHLFWWSIFLFPWILLHFQMVVNDDDLLL